MPLAKQRKRQIRIHGRTCCLWAEIEIKFIRFTEFPILNKSLGGLNLKFEDEQKMLIHYIIWQFNWVYENQFHHFGCEYDRFRWNCLRLGWDLFIYSHIVKSTAIAQCEFRRWSFDIESVVVLFMSRQQRMSIAWQFYSNILKWLFFDFTNYATISKCSFIPLSPNGHIWIKLCEWKETTKRYGSCQAVNKIGWIINNFCAFYAGRRLSSSRVVATLQLCLLVFVMLLSFNQNDGSFVLQMWNENFLRIAFNELEPLHFFVAEISNRQKP